MYVFHTQLWQAYKFTPPNFNGFNLPEPFTFDRNQCRAPKVFVTGQPLGAPPAFCKTMFAMNDCKQIFLITDAIILMSAFGIKRSQLVFQIASKTMSMNAHWQIPY